jgi:hypothetical protein
VPFHCFTPSVLNRFLTLALGIRSSRQQFSRIMCRAGLGWTNWKPWRNALLLLTVAWTLIFPIRNMRSNATTSPIGNSIGSVAESPRSLISSVLPETEPIARERILRSTYNLNLKSRRASRRLSTFGLSVGFSPLFRSRGTTRSRVSFFLNRFRKLGFVDYGDGGMQVHSSLLNVVLHD